VATLSKAQNSLIDSHLGLEGQVWNVPPLEHQTWQILELETFGSKHHSCYPESLPPSAVSEIVPVAKLLH
jgi:hypothetical protein